MTTWTSPPSSSADRVTEGLTWRPAPPGAADAAATAGGDAAAGAVGWPPVLIAEDLLADGIVTRQPGLVLAVFTADCVPVLLADPAAGVVGAVHAGWRGLAAGVVEAGVAAFAGLGADLGASVALVGPAIGPCCYEVGPEVAEAVGERYSAAAATTLKGSLAIDTTAAAVQALERAGVGAVRAAQQCTAHQPERFFSYRRDGTTGRQAGLVAILERGPA